MVTVSLVVELDTRYTRVERTRCANHTSLHTRVQLLILCATRQCAATIGRARGGGGGADNRSPRGCHRRISIAPSTATRAERACPCFWSAFHSGYTGATVKSGMNSGYRSRSQHARCVYPIASIPSRAHRGGPGACAHPGAGAVRAPQRPQSVPPFCSHCGERGKEISFPSDPLAFTHSHS